MKNLFLSLTFMLTSVFSFANTDPIIEKIVLANFEVLNVNSESIRDLKFKRNDCQTGGFSYFSPFYEVKGLEKSVISSRVNDDKVQLNLKYDNSNYNLTLSNFVISEDGKSAEFETEIDNFVFKSALQGFNLSKEFILNSFTNIEDSTLLNKVCPPCAYVAYIAVAATITYLCHEAQTACSPCDGRLSVGACSCSCIPKNG